MSLPLAHPAGILPLRRYDPRYPSLPALIIGSLSPDVGYFSEHFRLGEFSHRLLPSTFEFCLPVGLVLEHVFSIARLPVVGILPSNYRRTFRPFCQRTVGSPFVTVVSLLIGAWTHLVLDSITHEDGWLVEHLPVLQAPVLSGGVGAASPHRL